MLGLAELLMDTPEAAAHQLEKTLELAQALDRRRYTAEAHQLLSQAHEALGRFDKALAHYKSYHALERALQEERSGKRVKSMTLQLDLERAQREGELHRLRTVELGRANEALEAINEKNSELLAKLKQQAEILEKQTKEDALTGLYNRRHFDAALDAEIGRSRRFGGDVGLVMLDLDGFKRVNDEHGHAEGDRVLSEVAALLRSLTRDVDHLARYGGDEIAVVLPETDLEGAQLLAERVRAGVERLRLRPSGADEPLPITASIGIAGFPESAEYRRGLLRAADGALYQAKRGGGNRVVRADSTTVPR